MHKISNIELIMASIFFGGIFFFIIPRYILPYIKSAIDKEKIEATEAAKEVQLLHQKLLELQRQSGKGETFTNEELLISYANKVDIAKKQSQANLDSIIDAALRDQHRQARAEVRQVIISKIDSAKLFSARIKSCRAKLKTLLSSNVNE